MPQNSTTILKTENLAVSYGAKTVVDAISFEAEQGDYLAVVGENGSGKSTLMKAVLGLVKHEGKVEFKIKNTVGYLPQRAEVDADFPASVEEVVFSGALGKGKLFLSKADKERAYRNLERLGILYLKKRPFSELSGGQRQRVLLARAITASGDIIMLDEPVAGLDAAASAELYADLKKLNDGGMTVIMITHDFVSGLKNCNKVLYLENGKIKFFGTAKEYSDSGYFCRREAYND